MNLLLVMALAVPADDPHDDMSLQAVGHAVPAPSDWILVPGEQDGGGFLEAGARLRLSGGRLKLYDLGRGELDVKYDGAAVGFSVSYRSGLMNMELIGRSYPGVYQYDGDHLTVCIGRRDARPADCSTHPGDGRLLLVFKRKKTTG